MGSKASAEFVRLVAARHYTRWVNAVSLAIILAAEDDPANIGKHAILMGEVKEAAQDFIETLTEIVASGNGSALTIADVCEIREVLTPEDTDELLADLMHKL